MKDFFNNTCVKCGEFCKVEKDHIVPLRCDGSSDSIKNIQPLCSYCNASKSDQIDYRVIFCKKHGLKIPKDWRA